MSDRYGWAEIEELEQESELLLARLHQAKALNAELLAALEEFVECAMCDPMMEGPRFKGWDRSGLDRCLLKARELIAEAAIARAKETT